MTANPISVQDVLDAIGEILGPGRNAAAIEAGSRLVDLGLDSLDAAELFLMLEDRVGQPLDPGSAGELVHVEDLTKLQPA